MPEHQEHQHQHHHHHRRKDSATRFKERSLRAIEIQRLVLKYLKIVVFAIAVLMVLAVIASKFIQ